MSLSVLWRAALVSSSRRRWTSVRVRGRWRARSRQHGPRAERPAVRGAITSPTSSISIGSRMRSMMKLSSKLSCNSLSARDACSAGRHESGLRMYEAILLGRVQQRHEIARAAPDVRHFNGPKKMVAFSLRSSRETDPRSSGRLPSHHLGPADPSRAGGFTVCGVLSWLSRSRPVDRKLQSRLSALRHRGPTPRPGRLRHGERTVWFRVGRTCSCAAFDHRSPPPFRPAFPARRSCDLLQWGDLQLPGARGALRLPSRNERYASPALRTG